MSLKFLAKAKEICSDAEFDSYGTITINGRQYKTEVYLAARSDMCIAVYDNGEFTACGKKVVKKHSNVCYLVETGFGIIHDTLMGLLCERFCGSKGCEKAAKECPILCKIADMLKRGEV